MNFGRGFLEANECPTVVPLNASDHILHKVAFLYYRFLFAIGNILNILYVYIYIYIFAYIIIGKIKSNAKLNFYRRLSVTIF